METQEKTQSMLKNIVTQSMPITTTTITISMAISTEKDNKFRKKIPNICKPLYSWLIILKPCKCRNFSNIQSLFQTIMATQSTNEVNTIQILQHQPSWILSPGRRSIYQSRQHPISRTHLFLYTWINYLAKCPWNDNSSKMHCNRLFNTWNTHVCSTTPTPNSFAHFLWIFYNPIYSKYITIKETWTEIYTYALNWGFNKIQGLCWQEIIHLDTQEAATSTIWFIKHQTSILMKKSHELHPMTFEGLTKSGRFRSNRGVMLHFYLLSNYFCSTQLLFFS